MSPLVLFAVSLAASAPTAPATPQGPDWDLKGFRLGMGLDEVRGLDPALKCDAQSHDPGLVYCLDRESTLGGEKAFVAIKLLDNHVVYIGLENLSYAQVSAAVPTLIEKFGQPDVSNSVVDSIAAHGSKRTVARNQYGWHRDADIVIQTEPFDWTDDKRDVTYSSIILMAEAEQKQWGIRFNAKQRATDL